MRAGAWVMFAKYPSRSSVAGVPPVGSPAVSADAAEEQPAKAIMLATASAVRVRIRVGFFIGSPPSGCG
jgi:hypothetical protein